MDSSQQCSADAGRCPQPALPATPLPQGSPASPPWILDRLFQNLSYDLEQVANVIDPILTAQNHCYRTHWYVQGIVAQGQAFLTTNINAEGTIQITLCGTRWLLGRGATCAVVLPEGGMADCHATLNFDPYRGFFISDLGNLAGTWVNGRRLDPVQRHYLHDGDLVKLGGLRFEFLQQCYQPIDCEEN
jgi:pSer/pThr/pTyr-binding forkhead associated (FHA) protein